MPRLRQVAKADADRFAQQLYKILFGGRDPVKEPGTATGTPGNWWTVFALVPDAFKHTTEGFQFYRSPNRKLDPKLRELEEIRAGFARGSQFVFSQHCKACRDVGLSEEQIEAIPHWQIADCYAPVERAQLVSLRLHEGSEREFRRVLPDHRRLQPRRPRGGARRSHRGEARFLEAAGERAVPQAESGLTAAPAAIRLSVVKPG